MYLMTALSVMGYKLSRTVPGAFTQPANNGQCVTEFNGLKHYNGQNQIHLIVWY